MEDWMFGARFDTASLPRGDRVRRWQRHITRNLIELAQVDMDGEPFSATCATARFRDLAIVDISCSRHVVERNRTNNARAPKASVFVSLMLEGTGFLYQGSDCVVLAPGDVVVYDPARPYLHGFTSTVRQITFDLSAEAFSCRLGPWKEDRPVVIASDRGIGACSSAALAASVRQVFGAEPQRRGGSAERMWSIVGEAIDTALPGRSLSQAATREFERIKARCEAGLSEPDFDLEALCAELKLSRRRVQRRFQAAGTTFRSWLRDRRLREAAALLSDPRFRHWSITEIANECCLFDRAYFSRAFRATFGQSPSEWREFGPSAYRSVRHDDLRDGPISNPDYDR